MSAIQFSEFPDCFTVRVRFSKGMLLPQDNTASQQVDLGVEMNLEFSVFFL